MVSGEGEKKNRANNNMWGRDLPEDVSMEILSRLSVKSLMHFKCISKSWYALITNPYFITKHLNSPNPHTGAILGHISWMDGRCLCWLSNETLEMSGDEVHFSQLFQDEEQVEVVDIFGPCNGILCLAGTLMMENGGLQPDYEIVLWNPATRESKIIPQMDMPTKTFKANFGFGYDPKTNDYKVVRILSFDSHSHCQVVVYSLSTNSWRVIDSTPNPSYSISLPRYPSYLNGVHHWWAGASGKLPFLLSFDMSNEVFQEVLGPLSEGSFSSEVAVVNDSVALILRCSSDWKNCPDWESEDWLEIWVLNESGVERPWTRISTIPYPWDLNLIQLREDGSLVLSNDDGYLNLYDPRTQEWKPLQLNEALHAQIVSYTESLVFLNGSRGNKTIHNKIPHHFGDQASNSFS